MHIENRVEKIVHIAGLMLVPGKRGLVPEKYIDDVRKSGLFRAGHICEVPGDGMGSAVKPITAFTAPEALRAVSDSSDLSALEASLAEENASASPRKPVLSAIRSRIEALSTKG